MTGRALVDLNIGIVTWNTASCINQCLDSVLAESQGIGCAVIVVDNASSDGTVEIIRSRLPQVDLICNQVNRGFAAATMQAFRRTPARYYLMLNPDTVVAPGTLKGMVSYMDNHPQVGIATCRMLNAEGSLAPSVRHFPTFRNQMYDALGLPRIWPHDRKWAELYWRWFDYDQEQEADQVIGAFALIRGEAFHRLGGLDEQFFVYDEDIDLCLRAKQDGWKIMYVPYYEVRHLGGVSTNQGIAQRIAYLYESRYRYFMKHHPNHISKLRWVIILTCFTHSVGALFAKPRQLLDYWRGYSLTLKTIIRMSDRPAVLSNTNAANVGSKQD